MVLCNSVLLSARLARLLTLLPIKNVQYSLGFFTQDPHQASSPPLWVCGRYPDLHDRVTLLRQFVPDPCFAVQVAQQFQNALELWVCALFRFIRVVNLLGNRYRTLSILTMWLLRISLQNNCIVLTYSDCIFKKLAPEVWTLSSIKHRSTELNTIFI